MTQQRNVAILIFDNVEVLDFAGPFEVFSVTRLPDGTAPFKVYTVAETSAPIAARNGLSVNPHYTIHDCPPSDILLVPGGNGTRPLLNHNPILDWIRTQNETTELTLSVCTGALLLGRAGLLEGLAATTYHSEFDLLREAAPTVELRPGERWVDNGKVVTSAGVSAGIDMSLHIVARLFGEAQAEDTARRMEYEYWTHTPAR